VALMGFAGSMFDTTFNNFLSDTFNLGPTSAGSWSSRANCRGS